MPLSRKSTPLRIGFIPLLDAAPLIAARELGLFGRAGLDVRIKSEPGWATIHDKLLCGEIDAAHALVGQPLAMRADGHEPATTISVPMFLNRGGAHIVLSRHWVDQGITTAKQLMAAARSSASGRKLVLGSEHRLSSHGFLLEQWLREGGANEEEAQFVHLPPSLLARNVHSGHLDGFCAGEPWCAHTTVEGWGQVVASGEALEPNCPDKVLMVSGACRNERPEDAVAMSGCIIKAAQWCDDPVNHPSLATMLAQRNCIGLPAGVVQHSLNGARASRAGEPCSRVRFNREALQPSGKRLTWLARQWRNHQWDGIHLLPSLLDSTLFAEAIEHARLNT